MSDAFARHNITHLSASTINTFARQPALFVLEKLLKRRTQVGASAHRGTAAEAGIVHGLLDPRADIEACQAVAVQTFDRLTALSPDPRKTKEREAVPMIVARALPELRLYGVPDMIQAKIERELPGVPVPFVGYIDLGWSEHAITLDIKSQLKLSSEISVDHARQVAIYVHNTNHEARVAYCTPSKLGIYRLEHAARHIHDTIAVAKTIERFLSVSDDPLVLAGIVCPDLTSFYFSDPNTAALAREVFGFAPEIAAPMEHDARSPAALETAGNLESV
jgi:hypothetical protein